MIIIKRYQNRKLYDTTQHCYVTLAEIERMILSRKKIKVIDNKTKMDITSKTLVQVHSNQLNNVGFTATEMQDKILDLHWSGVQGNF
tara:strand:- start:33364 stop:33624 length:261 start_codon:yes stop_codon:yes gene_type:complete